MIKLNTKIGKYAVQIEFKSMKDLHKFGGIYGNLPRKCDACGSDELYLSFKNPGGNDYYTIQCGACTADANFGIHKDGTGLFWKGEKMSVYVPNGEQNQSNNAPKQQNPAQNTTQVDNSFDKDDEDVPF